MDARRKFWLAAIVLLDSLIVVCLGTIAFAFPGLQGLSPELRRGAIIRILSGVFSKGPNVLTLALIVAGALWAIFLIAFLRQVLKSKTNKFILVSGAAGMVYGYLVAAMTIVLFVPLSIWHHVPKEANLPYMVVGTLYSTFIVLFAAVFLPLIMYAPIILVGGSLMGVLNGVLVKELL